MIELPESIGLAGQLNETIQGKVIKRVQANASLHKFAWFFGDPEAYHAALTGRTVGRARGIGGKVEITVEDQRILLAEGVVIRYYQAGEKLPPKHQLLLMFADSSALVCSVRMYGGLWVFPEGANHDAYYHAAKCKPSPLSDLFDLPYFLEMAEETPDKSAKAFLAMEQRIPGLGNGVLQDILFNAHVHPKTKINLLTEQEMEVLFNSIKTTLCKMTVQGGRDTETDLFGNPGGYKTLLSRNTVGKPCPLCGGAIVKASYMGGSVYYCPVCQKERK